MGRKNRSATVPQRSRLIANQELRKAIKAGKPETFGARLPFETDIQVDILSTYRIFDGDGALPDKLKVRPGLWNTLVPQKLLTSQVAKGIVLGYELGRRSVGFIKELKSVAPEEGLVVELGDPIIIGNGNLGYRLVSDELEDLHTITRFQLGELGIKGALREAPSIHATVADAEKRLSRVEKQFALDALIEIREAVASLQERPKGQAPLVQLEPVEIYK